MHRYSVKRSALLLVALIAFGICSQAAGANGAATPSFPRLMGMNIGAKNYEDAGYQRDLSRLDVVRQACTPSPTWSAIFIKA